MTPLYPLSFTPVYQDYLWGGQKFDEILGRPIEPGKVYAESWEVADLDAGQSVVEDGPLAGTPLHHLVVERGAELLGRHHPRPRFPLLLKYLDAHRRLSVQVHPDDEQAARMGLADPGKTEAWVVLHAEPGSLIWCGFRRPVDRDTLAAAIARGDVPDLLHGFEPRVGQCLFIPARTVHALGEGLLVAEIQQNSNNTFRVFDWNRLGPDGKPRPLHVEQALEVIDYRQGPRQPQDPAPPDRDGVEELVRCDRFVLERRTLGAPRTVGGDDRCRVVTVVEGAVAIGSASGDRTLARARTALLPAAIGPVELAPRGDRPAVALVAYLP
jgi:mannose-6-phosphate isomerase